MHYAIRTNVHGPGWHLKSWLVQTLADGENWQEVGRKEDNWHLSGFMFTADGPAFTAIFAAADGVECRFIWLMNIGRSCPGNDSSIISAWQIFGNLLE
jgi:hypothetical protein